MAIAVDLDAEIQRECTLRRISDLDVAEADILNQPRTEILVDLVLPAHRL